MHAYGEIAERLRRSELAAGTTPHGAEGAQAKSARRVEHRGADAARGPVHQELVTRVQRRSGDHTESRRVVEDRRRGGGPAHAGRQDHRVAASDEGMACVPAVLDESGDRVAGVDISHACPYGFNGADDLVPGNRDRRNRTEYVAAQHDVAERNRGVVDPNADLVLRWRRHPPWLKLEVIASGDDHSFALCCVHGSGVRDERLT